MEILETPIKDLLIIKPRVFNDARGYFFETYNAERYHEAGIAQDFVQDNLSKSSFGVVRGLHFQRAPYSQSKLVSVTVGRVWDVAVDLRAGSPTYGQWYGVELTDENHLQYLIPRGFAHGFSVLSETAIFTYKCDNLYHPEADGGIMFNDPDLGIDWKIPAEKMLLSEKDTKHPLLKEINIKF
jgi:dTDP-4-dehydrorhamnose 3,5-epimerase